MSICGKMQCFRCPAVSNELSCYAWKGTWRKSSLAQKASSGAKVVWCSVKASRLFGVKQLRCQGCFVYKVSCIKESLVIPRVKRYKVFNCCKRLQILRMFGLQV